MRANLGEYYSGSYSRSRKNRRRGHTCGIDPIPGRCALFTSDNDSGTFLLPGFDVAPNTVVLRFGDLETGGQTQTETRNKVSVKTGAYHRAASRLFIEPITYDKFLSFSC